MRDYTREGDAEASGAEELDPIGELPGAGARGTIAKSKKSPYSPSHFAMSASQLYVSPL